MTTVLERASPEEEDNPGDAEGAGSHPVPVGGTRARVALPVLFSCAAILAWSAWYAVFTSVEYFDDEGDWLVELKMFYEHGSLYHNTWSQAGPFYYDFWAAVFGLLHAPINIDTGRLAGLGTWVGVSLASGVLAWLASRRLSTALVAQLGVFLVMEGLSAEPLEPAGLASLLVVLALLAGAWLRRYRPRASMYAVGALVAAAVFSKVNLGVFLAGGAVAAALMAGPPSRWSARRHGLALAVLVLLPLALCASLIRLGSVDNLVGIVMAGGAALVVTGARTPRPQPLPLGWPDAARAALGGLAGTAVVLAVGLATGTTVGELVRGALLSQRDLAQQFSAPPPVIVADIPIAALSLCAAIVITLPAVRRRLSLPMRVAGRAIIGTFIVLTCVGGLLTQVTFHNLTHMQVLLYLVEGKHFYAGPLTWGTSLYAASFCWLAVRKPGPDGVSRFCFARALLATVALLLALEAYPVSGHQMSWSTLGLVMVGALVINDAVTLASSAVGQPRWVPLARRGTVTVALGLAALNVIGFTANYATLYHRNVKTTFDSASLVRWPEPVVATFEGVATLLSTHCSTYYSLPGLNSFYFFTGQTPPTGLDTTQWMYLMDRADQERVVQALRHSPRACVLYDAPALYFWEHWKPLPRTSPLLVYMQENFGYAGQDNGYVVLVRTRAGHAPPLPAKEWAPRFRVRLQPINYYLSPYFT